MEASSRCRCLAVANDVAHIDTTCALQLRQCLSLCALVSSIDSRTDRSTGGTKSSSENPCAFSTAAVSTTMKCLDSFSTHQTTPNCSHSAIRSASQSLCEFPCLTFSRMAFLRPGMPLGNLVLRTGGVTATEKLEHIGAAPRDRTAPLRMSNSILLLSSGSNRSSLGHRFQSQNPRHVQLHHLSGYTAPSRKKIQCSSFHEIRLTFCHNKLAFLEDLRTASAASPKGQLQSSSLEGEDDCADRRARTAGASWCKGSFLTSLWGRKSMASWLQSSPRLTPEKSSVVPCRRSHCPNSKSLPCSTARHQGGLVVAAVRTCLSRVGSSAGLYAVS